MGYLRIPHLGYPTSFFHGFFYCLTIVCLLLLLNRIFFKRNTQGRERNSRVGKLIFVTIASLFLFFVFRDTVKVQFLQAQLEKSTNKITRQQNRINQLESREYGELLAGLIEDVKQELEQDSLNKLSRGLVEQIAIASQSMSPYLRKQDSNGVRVLSPERGELLKLLMTLDIHPASWVEVKKDVSFEHADLSKYTFTQVDLSGTNLSGADLSNSTFKDVSLRQANMFAANVHNADFDNAILDSADLRRGVLSWCRLSNCSVEKADADGVQLLNCCLSSCSLDSSLFNWAAIDGGIFSKVTWNNGHLFKANVTGANFRECSFRNTVLRTGIFLRCNFEHSLLTNAEVGENWFESMIEQNNVGLDLIQNDYQPTELPTSNEAGRKFRLAPLQP